MPCESGLALWPLASFSRGFGVGDSCDWSSGTHSHSHSLQSCRHNAHCIVLLYFESSDPLRGLDRRPHPASGCGWHFRHAASSVLRRRNPTRKHLAHFRLVLRCSKQSSPSLRSSPSAYVAHCRSACYWRARTACTPTLHLRSGLTSWGRLNVGLQRFVGKSSAEPSGRGRQGSGTRQRLPSNIVRPLCPAALFRMESRRESGAAAAGDRENDNAQSQFQDGGRPRAPGAALPPASANSNAHLHGCLHLCSSMQF